MSESTTVLFGLSDVRVQWVEVDGSGARAVHVTTDDVSAAGCPGCGVISTSVKANVTTVPKDLPYGETAISVVWHKTRWRCREPSCGKQTFTEVIAEVPPRRRTTGRLRRAIGAAVADACRSVAEAADSFGVSWPTAHAAVVDKAAAELVEPEPTEALGIDETRRGRPRWRLVVDDQAVVDQAVLDQAGGPHGGQPAAAAAAGAGRWVRTDPWDTGFVDLAGSQGLLGQVEGRTSGCVVEWLQARTPEFRQAVRWVAIDPAANYAKAVTTVGLLPNAVLVVDHFHIVALANAAVTAVRRRTIWEQQGRRGRAVDPAWANRRRLLTGKENLSDKAFVRMWNSLIDADPTGQILTAWIAKEELRKLLALARTRAADYEIRARLWKFYAWCARSDIDELHTLATTVETWWPAILAFIHTGITNARTEGLNRLVKQVKRSGCGFRNVTNSHRRIRLHCTRTQRAATATSTRSARLSS